MDDENQGVPARAGDLARAIEDTAAKFERKTREAISRGQPTVDVLDLAAAAFVLREVVYTIRDLTHQLADARNDGLAATVDAIRADGGIKPVRMGTPSHRHNYDKHTNLCACGKEKSATAGGRPRKSAPVAVDGVAKIDPPSAHLPLGDAAADRFAGGGLGSSGVRR